MKELKRQPRKGDLAVCSLGILGLITSEEPESVSYKDGNKGIAWTGVKLTEVGGQPGMPWSSRNPRILGKFTPELLYQASKIHTRVTNQLGR